MNKLELEISLHCSCNKDAPELQVKFSGEYKIKRRVKFWCARELGVGMCKFELSGFGFEHRQPDLCYCNVAQCQQRAVQCGGH